jgi:hypothetical protein
VDGSFVTRFKYFEGILRQGAKEGEKGSLMKLHNEELNDVYSSPNNTTVLTSREFRRKGNILV